MDSTVGQFRRADRQGKQVYYEADDAHVRRMVEDMVTHVAEH